MSEALLQVKDLHISFDVDGKRSPAVEGVSFEIHPGEIVGLVGESGSGKSVSSMSALRLIPSPPGAVEKGEILYKGQDLLTMSLSDLRRVRGSEISVIFQEPMTALSPLQTVGAQLAETLRIHKDLSRDEAWTQAVEWLRKVGIPDPEERAKAYPFQFSGGMRQRVMIAMALILKPRLIIADEPTTALDVTLQKQIFDLILEMKADETSILFITHDMGAIWELADRVLVMKNGRVVERGETEALFADPQEDYTQSLLAAVPRLTDEPLERRAYPEGEAPLLDVRNLRTWFPIKRGVFARTVGYVKAVDDVSFSIFEGECYGLVGESGSGKSTIGRTILGLETARSGEVIYADKQDLTKLGRKEMRPFLQDLQMIFQDPFSSLNPRLTVLELLTEGLVEHGILKGSRADVAAHWLGEVGLPADAMNRYPHEFSGGQRQRICIARAIAVEPKFVVCDEAVSALDVTIQAEVIDLLMELKERLRLSYLFISHDLSVVKRICDRTMVLQGGKCVEEGLTSDIIENPQDPYTQKLLSAVPIPGDASKRLRRTA